MNFLKSYVREINNNVKDILKERYIGVYIHGSTAEGYFKWERSDVDVLVLMNGHLNSNEKLKLLNVFQDLSKNGPKKGIELSILNKSAIQLSDYPLPYEFHYSQYWYESVMADGWENIDRKYLLDEDLTSHIYNLHHHHIVVEGPPVEEVFPMVDEKYFFKSIEFDEKDATVKVVDTIMNLCRFDVYLQTGRMVSKKEGLKIAIELFKEYNQFLKKIQTLYNNNEVGIPLEDHEEANKFKGFMLRKREKK
jgi:predicted nucleotidyltransferase